MPRRAAAPSGPATTPSASREPAGSSLVRLRRRSSRLRAERPQRRRRGRRRFGGARHLERRDLQDVSSGHDDGALDDVLELADVARPVPLLQRSQARRGMLVMWRFMTRARTSARNSGPASGCPPCGRAAAGPEAGTRSTGRTDRCGTSLRPTICCRFAIGRGNQADIGVCVRVLPSRSNSRSCSTRRSLGWISIGMSPISSRKSVPWCASSMRPDLAGRRRR